MQSKELIEKLKVIFEKNDVCRIERKNIDEFNKSVKPIICNDKFLLFCYEYDFEFDGFQLIRLCDITDIKYDEVDIFISNILRKENIIAETKKIMNFRIDNFKTILEYFFNNNENIIIECEKISEFNIGKIIEIYDDHIIFLNFDGEGTWYKDPLAIYYDDITSISFRNRYVKYMSKYAHS